MKTYEEFQKFLGEWMYHNLMGGGQSHERPTVEQVVEFIYGRKPNHSEIKEAADACGRARGWK